MLAIEPARQFRKASLFLMFVRATSSPVARDPRLPSRTASQLRFSPLFRSSTSTPFPRVQGATMADTKEKIKEGVDKAAEKTKEAVDGAAHKASEAARAAGKKVKEAGEKIEDAGE